MLTHPTPVGSHVQNSESISPLTHFLLNIKFHVSIKVQIQDTHSINPTHTIPYCVLSTELKAQRAKAKYLGSYLLQWNGENRTELDHKTLRDSKAQSIGTLGHSHLSIKIELLANKSDHKTIYTVISSCTQCETANHKLDPRRKALEN